MATSLRGTRVPTGVLPLERDEAPAADRVEPSGFSAVVVGDHHLGGSVVKDVGEALMAVLAETLVVEFDGGMAVGIADVGRVAVDEGVFVGALQAFLETQAGDLHPLQLL